ncbi:hypothetical protein C427_5075 [Paraglaciecola psychrophila 170]|uniref:Uncharacterized protein n=1 Tax=Paraglaciecola psychrophila 170 TaxID=1129794 RepID=K6Z2U9_9ALTE|nr:hypothetical protein C427_5075 [Paraglaciecola psychrophila 170]GAC39369.1 hypothetical protein GPSY_3758 [Paraglaciecola psychrophila 170]
MIEEIITPIRIDFSKKDKDFNTGNIKYFLLQVILIITLKSVS